MQTILGSTGVIGSLLAKELTAYTNSTRLVSRNPKKVNETDELFSADLLNREQVFESVKGSDVVYLTAGLKYNIKVWQTQWPIVMRNVIDACIQHNSKLVFFDNIYMISKDSFSNITEESSIEPCSKKGEVRAALDKMILDEIGRGNLQAIIARAADFYGPGTEKVSVLSQLVIENVKKGKKAQWFIDPQKKHSFTFVPDAAKAVAILGNTEDAFNQVWNVPTTPALTGKEAIKIISALLNEEPKTQVVSSLMLGLISIFVPVLREFAELKYQWDRDYIFNSSKFEMRFNFTPTKFEDGVKQMLL